MTPHTAKNQASESWMARQGPRRFLRLRTSLCGAGMVALACCVLANPLFAKKSRPGEYDVKAAYLFNFGRFVSWPDQGSVNNGVFPICVLGQDPFGRALDNMLTGEKINGAEVTIRRLQRPEEALNCRLLFISASEDSRLQAILQVLGKSPVLTVSDLPNFTRHGGMIQFVLEDERVRFSVNLAAAENSGLVLSSQLLKVASSIQGSTRAGDFK
jgi:hypothetical protein